MKGVWASDQDEERAFAEKAAKHFAEHPEHWTYGDGADLVPGAWLALRWGMDNDCVVVVKISDDHDPVNYYELVGKYTDKKQPSIRHLIAQNAVLQDTLWALNAVMREIERRDDRGPRTLPEGVWDKAQAALAKARGES